MPILAVFIGNKGSGKSAALCFLANYVHQQRPTVPIVTNTPIWFDNPCPIKSCKIQPKFMNPIRSEHHHKMAILRRQAMKWLATKVVLKDRRYAMIGIDEAAMSEDLESRGSGTYSTAPRTWLLAVSRKAHCDIFLLTQMMSMVDKRAQWIGDRYILCIGHYIHNTLPPRVDHFEYRVFNEDLKRINTWVIDGKFAERYIFKRYETDDVPISNERITQISDFFDVDEEAKKEFERDFMIARQEYRMLLHDEYVNDQVEEFIRNTGEITQEDKAIYKRDMGLE